MKSKLSKPSKGGVIFAGLMAHAPVLIPGLALDRPDAAATIENMRRLAARAVSTRPDSVLIISPHSPRRHGRFGIWSGARLRGNFSEFGLPDAYVDLPNDESLVAGLRTEAAKGPVELWDIRPSPVDHGALVPLWHLVAAAWTGPTVVLGLNYPGEGNLGALGKLIATTAEQLKRRLAIVASGDMSHRLTPEAPGGYEPQGVEFDRQFIDLLRQGNLLGLSNLDPELMEAAGQDAVESVTVAVAAVNGDASGHEVLGYEGPFGVGYGVAVLFDPRGAETQGATDRQATETEHAGSAEPCAQEDPTLAGGAEAGFPGRWWSRLEDGRIECGLCPRFCRLQEGQRGFCFVRQRLHNRMVLTTYGRSSGFCVDPIEKKPLNHFYPGTSVLSFGTAGCNLGCRFCQNWEISKARHSDRLNEMASPEAIAGAACQLGCKSIAFTYNDPVIFAEYAIDVAAACRAAGLQTVAVTAGYISREPRAEFFRSMDAANVDLKGFTEGFYHKLCFGQLAPVLETLEYLHRETQVWLEVTSLLIPGWNDDEHELHWAAEWFAEHLGVDVPWHFTAFHPDFKLLNAPPTPRRTLEKARQIALSKGIHYVYTGNIEDPAGASTRCPRCATMLVQRRGYELDGWNLANGHCPCCRREIAGRFDARPGPGRGRRTPVCLA